jgi:porphobilinogen synthase
MTFPVTRMRRLRGSENMRDLASETRLRPDDLVQPLFVDAAKEEPADVPSMPGVRRHTLSSLVKEAKRVEEAGVPAVALFGVPEEKDEMGSRAYAEDGIVQEALRRLGDATDLVLVADLCLCEYTDHGHCGVLEEGEVHNDLTLDLYQRIASSQAEAGADVVSPSGMMDGQVAAVREALDADGYKDTAILSYAAKYASSFYGPFRDAADSAPQHGDRDGYQMDPRNAQEALQEVGLDLEEGADMVMVKPGLPYLDVLRQVKDNFRVPTLAYQVSGEYASIHAAADQGWLDREDVAREALTSLRRAGADAILTYFARDVAEDLEG